MYHGIIKGTPTFGAGKFGNGLTATSDTNYIELPAGTFNFGATADWTIEAVLSTPMVGGVQVAVGTTAPNAIWFGTNSGHFVVSINGSGGFASLVFDSGMDIADGHKHHCEIVMMGGTTLCVFVDGVLCGSATGVFAPPDGSVVCHVGCFGASGGFAWQGGIDELALWDMARHTATFTPPATPYSGLEAGLRALYHFEADGADNAGGALLVANDVIVGEVGPTTTAISWRAATGGTGVYTYQVQRAPDNNGDPGAFVNVGVPQSGLTYLATELLASTRYWWQVVVTDSANASATSHYMPVVTLAAGKKYNRVLGHGEGTGRDLMILVPNAFAAKPYNAAVATPLVLYFHGSGEGYDALTYDPLKDGVVNACMNAGYVCAGISAGETNWGNQAGCDAYPDLYKFVSDRYNIGPVLFLSQSMGGFTGLLSLSQQKIPNVVAWAGIYPAVNLRRIYGDGGFTAPISAAYGCDDASYWAKTNGHDPCRLWGAAFRGVPMRFYASPDDRAILKEDNTDVFRALVAAHAPEADVVVCSGDHGDPSHFQPADLVAFYERAMATPSYGAFPASTDVRAGVGYGGTYVGNLVVPSEGDVRLGVPVDDGLGTLNVPAPENVAFGVPVDATTGTATITATSIRDAIGMAHPDMDIQLLAIRNGMAALEGSPITAICINPERSEESDYDNLRRNPADCC